MIAALAPHAGVSQRHDRPGLRAGERLQAGRSRSRETQGLAGDVVDGAVFVFIDRPEQALVAQQVGDFSEGPHRLQAGAIDPLGKFPQKTVDRLRGLGRQPQIQQTLGIVEGGTENLPARYLPEGR